MKDELQTKLVEILTSIQNAAGKAGDFAMAQLPDIAQTYILYGSVVAAIKVMGFAIAVAAFAFAFRWFWKNPTYSNWSWDEGKNVRSDGSWAALVLCTVLGITAFTGLTVSITEGALVWLAPKVWLLKEIASMLK